MFPSVAPTPALAESAPAPPLPSDDSEQPFFVRKRIAVLGARGVGKSAVAIQCAMNRFEPDYMPTFEATYPWRPAVDGVHYDVSIVDTDGQDEHSSFGLQYTIGVDGYVLMFSVRDESSFEVIKAVNTKLLDTLSVFKTKGTSEVPRILVGNQIDILHERQVPSKEAQTYADEQGIPYLETSAYTARNVPQVFIEVLRMIHRNLYKNRTPEPPEVPERPERPPDESSRPRNPCLVQ